jgi:hypothetical protein
MQSGKSVGGDEMNDYYTVEMVRHIQKVVAETNKELERLKHLPRATKYSTTKFYNFNNKRKKGKTK